VWQGDCRELLRTLPDGSVAAIATSPPYNIGTPYSLHDDNLSDEAFFIDLLDPMAEQCTRVLRSDGSMFLVVGSNNEYPWRAFEIATVFDRYFELQRTYIWGKSFAIPSRTIRDKIFREALHPFGIKLNKQHCAALRDALHNLVIGQSLPAQVSTTVAPTHEYVFHFGQRSPEEPSKRNRTPRLMAKINSWAPRWAVPMAYPDQATRFDHAERKDRDRGTLLLVPPRTIQGRGDRYGHRAVFEVELIELLLSLADLKPPDLVLDPFCGIGSTLVAAKKLGLPSIGMEVDPKYCEAARKRLEEVEHV
jgi:site-specific DNA-methyltransferase (adenine-specific)